MPFARSFMLVWLLAASPLSADQGSRLVFSQASDELPSRVEKSSGYVFDITVQNEKQLDVILSRAESLKDQFSSNDHGRIALVLHGEELQLFRKSNYQQFMSIVERARQLDRDQLIDIKACRTVMNQLSIDESELPEFIEQVPLAPVEIERLEREKGFTRL